MAQLNEETSVELTSEKKVTLVLEEAQQLLLGGLKLVQEECYDSGIDQLSDALALMVDNYGELDYRTSVYYLEYGKALLKQADVLTNILLPSPQEHNPNEKELSDEKEPISPEQNNTIKPKGLTEHKPYSKPEDVHDKESQNKKDPQLDQKEEVSNNIHEFKTGNLQSTTQPSEPTNNHIAPPVESAKDGGAENRELAWQLFETARVTVANNEKLDDKEKSLQLGEVHRLLGEVALGGSNFDQGYGEFSTSIKLLGKTLPLSDPKIGRVQQLAGLCAVHGRQLEAAQFHYTAAAENHNMHLEELLIKEGVMTPRDPNEPESEDIEFVDGKYLDLLKEKVGEESSIFKKCFNIFGIINELIDRVEEFMEEEDQKKAELAKVMKVLAEKMRTGEFPGLKAKKHVAVKMQAKEPLVTEQVGFDSSQQPASEKVKELGTFGGKRRPAKRVAPLGRKLEENEAVSKKARTI